MEMKLKIVLRSDKDANGHNKIEPFIFNKMILDFFDKTRYRQKLLEQFWLTKFHGTIPISHESVRYRIIIKKVKCTQFCEK